MERKVDLLADGFMPSITSIAQGLRRAKEAHTAWEAKFEGAVPAHDWEVWYAQFMFVEGLREAGYEVEPLSMPKLHTAVGPLV